MLFLILEAGKFLCLSGLYKIDASIFEVPENAMKIQSQVKKILLFILKIWDILWMPIFWFLTAKMSMHGDGSGWKWYHSIDP